MCHEVRHVPCEIIRIIGVPKYGNLLCNIMYYIKFKCSCGITCVVGEVGLAYDGFILDEINMLLELEEVV